MSHYKQPLKQKVVHEVREYFLMAFYLYVVFSLFVVYKSLILAEHHIDFVRHVFTVVLACFKVAEDVVVGRIHGKSFHESIADLGGGTWKGILTLAMLLCVMLIPFFGFTELRRSSAKTG